MDSINFILEIEDFSMNTHVDIIILVHVNPNSQSKCKNNQKDRDSRVTLVIDIYYRWTLLIL